jgi:hypothetical protein
MLSAKKSGSATVFPCPGKQLYAWRYFLGHSAGTKPMIVLNIIILKLTPMDF